MSIVLVEWTNQNGKIAFISCGAYNIVIVIAAFTRRSRIARATQSFRIVQQIIGAQFCQTSREAHIFLAICIESQCNCFETNIALSAARCSPASAEGWQQNRSENRHDCDNDQNLQQRKCLPF